MANNDGGRSEMVPTDDIEVPEGQPHTQYEETYGRPYYVPMSDDYDIEFIPTEKLTNGKGNRDSPIDEEFVDQVHFNGIIAPIEVYEDDDAYVVTDGWRRRKAAVELGYETVPCRVWDDKRQALKQPFFNNAVNRLMNGKAPDGNDEWVRIMEENYPRCMEAAEK